MKIIHPHPYRPIYNYSEKNVIIELRAQDFSMNKFVDNGIEILFEHCYFDKLKIRSLEELGFPKVSISFVACCINEIQVDDLIPDMIDLGFYGSFISGKIKGSSLKAVEFNNCLLSHGLYLIDVPKIRITFTKENIKLYRWKKMFKPIKNFSTSSLFQNKQSYVISNPSKLEVTSNFVKAKKIKLNLNLSIQFNASSNDIQTIISNCQLDALSIQGSSSGQVDVENTDINKLYLYNFSPRTDVSFYAIKPLPEAADGKIGIHKCNLDNAWFNNVSFDKYKVISLFRSKFSKTLFTSCDFPESYTAFENFLPIENVHYPENRTKNDPKNLYEILLQLKKSMDSTGNYYEAQKIQSIAHNALHKISGIGRSDRFILWVNKQSNHHGLSIKRPFILLLCSSITLYILYLLSIGRIFTSMPIDWNLIGYYFSFLDITHRTDFLVDKELLTWAPLTIDYFTKVIVGFFIYQLIASFRKYGKK
jgi:hypothetical protein